MANLTEGIVAYLLTIPAITSLLAGGASIQPIPAPVDATQFPAVVYQVVSDINDMTISGATDLAHARILFSCLATYGPGSYGIAHSLGLAVKHALNGYQGRLPNGPKVDFAQVVNVTDMFQPDALLSCTNVHVLFAYSD